MPDTIAALREGIVGKLSDDIDPDNAEAMVAEYETALLASVIAERDAARFDVRQLSEALDASTEARQRLQGARTVSDETLRRYMRATCVETDDHAYTFSEAELLSLLRTVLLL